jgi:hypothetical protein
MIHITDIYALRQKLHKLKHQLDRENCDHHSKWLANEYLNRVLDYVGELKEF